MSTASESESDLPDPVHEAFTAWSLLQGIRINKVQASRVPRGGLGIIAQRRVEAGDELVDIPTSALLTEHSVPKDFKEKHGDITLHGLLASFLAFGGDNTEPYALWRSTWPSMTDFEVCMPMLWREDLRTRYEVDNKGCRSVCSLLPPAIGNGCWAHPLVSKFSNQTSGGLLDEQEKKFQRDWDIVNRTLPSMARYTYLYYWLIVNTRSFYHEEPGSKATRPKDDRMALCPFADFFNHADHGCRVAFDENGYTVTADRAYDAGEEIFFSYGSHSNDFLLVEYGFVLETNKWDFLPVDDLLLPNMLKSKLRRNRLETAGYLGFEVLQAKTITRAKYGCRDYRLTAEGLCFRTQVAVRTLTLNAKEWTKFREGQCLSDDASKQDEYEADAFIVENILEVYLWEAVEALKALKGLHSPGLQSQKDTLIGRWKQIRNIVQQAVE